MKKLLSISYSPASFNLAIFILRVSAGFLIIHHGYDKIKDFDGMVGHFINFMGLGQRISLSLAIFAEFFCAIFLILGLFTRLAVIPLIITMLVVTFQIWHGDVLGKGEHPALFLATFVTILLVGPGKISIDGAVNK